jgi:hypothetical protein
VSCNRNAWSFLPLLKDRDIKSDLSGKEPGTQISSKSSQVQTIVLPLTQCQCESLRDCRLVPQIDAESRFLCETHNGQNSEKPPFLFHFLFLTRYAQMKRPFKPERAFRSPFQLTSRRVNEVKWLRFHQSFTFTVPSPCNHSTSPVNAFRARWVAT